MVVHVVHRVRCWCRNASPRDLLANRIKCSEVMVELKCLFRAQTSRLFAGERFNDVFTDQPKRSVT